MQFHSLLLLATLVAVASATEPNPTYDHNATVSVDIGAPGWDSWAACMQQDGCTPSELRSQETFPVWQALINALHRGVTVRILTNDYSNQTAPGEGLIDPLTFMFLNGAQIRYFSTVTFLHTKYIATETTSSVSSVNFDFTSYMENREAGMIVTGPGSAPIRDYINTTFNADWAAGVPFKANQVYSKDNMKIIQDPTPIDVVIPGRLDIDAYETPLTTVTDNMPIGVIDSPDFAYSAILSALDGMQSSLKVMIYQITDDDMCDYLVKLGSDTVETELLVSATIFSPTDYASAQECYKRLHDAGFKVRLTSTVFKYSHQKFWIIDGTSLFMSTGNWGMSDYPNGSISFPPYGNSAWRAVNRDYTLQVNNSDVIAIFEEVFEKDYEAGSDWSPSEPVTLGVPEPPARARAAPFLGSVQARRQQKASHVAFGRRPARRVD